MTGGKVVETIELEDKIWVNCEDETVPQWNDKNFAPKQSAIYIEKTAAGRCVQDGDTIFWEGEYALWTPRKKAFTDYKLKRVGAVGVKRPKGKVGEKEVVPVK